MPDWGPVFAGLRTHARERPDAPAIEVGGETSLTYAQLLDAVSSYGDRLRAREFGSEARVGIPFARGPEFVVAVLGCWWAGLAFCPLDPDASELRQSALIERGGLRLVEGPPELRAAPMASSARPEPFDPGRLAYLIFTSGSTGRPKGVLVEHRGIPGLLRAQIAAFGLEPRSRVWWILSPLFDASLSDILTCLVAGACLCIEDEAPLRDASAFVQRIADRRITHVDLPPALLALLDPELAPACLQTLVIGGEVAPAEVVETWSERCRVINVYGPTEATICTSLVQGRTQGWPEGHLGDPITGTDYALEPSTGELIISGAGVARGYLDEDGELAARFFVNDAGQPSYRSGDRARVDAQGHLIFAGRIDRQLKVDGRLVSPEEIEAALTSHPACRRAYVFARESGRRRRLVAAVEADATDTSRLRDHVAQRIPEWMLPQEVHRFDALALGATGKIDGRAVELACACEAAAVPPTLGGLLARILNLPHVDPEASFESLGMSSLDRVEFLAAATPWGVTASALALAPNLRALEATVRDVRLEARSSAWLLDEARSTLASRPLPKPRLEPRPPQRVLLTGATGFLGTELIRQLSRDEQLELHCLVRGRNLEHARRRLVDALGVETLPGAVVVHRGDLAEDKLGLEDADYDTLGEELDTVVHGGALLSWTLGYEHLREVNVVGTRRALAFARHGRAKAFHHISSLAVFAGSDLDTGDYDEGVSLDRATTLYGGYAQSKWAAEALVRCATDHETPLTVHRLGLLTAHSQSGVGPAKDGLAWLVKGLCNLGCAPKLSPEQAAFAFDDTPVDFAATVIVRLLRRPAGTYNIAGRSRICLGELIAGLRKVGVELPEVDAAAWARRSSAVPEAAAAQLALTRVLDDGPRARERRAHDLFLATTNHFSMQRTLEVLGPDAPPDPAPASERLPRQLRYLVGEQR